ncbi:hypothetical protein K474DRAFT_1592044 [Panus rudis PR-1116 ss-1]|nr:hypothetical protein K474DRAFT_1592044 [Panus rudis PR-1116 ss-1]
MAILSEKAKGKQRAVDPVDSTPTPPPNKPLVIRFTEGVPDLTLQVKEGDTVRELKKSIRDVRPQLTDRRLRLIHSGRLLADNIDIYALLTSLQEKYRRAAEGEASGHAVDDTPPSTVWLHCSIGPQVTGDEEDDSKVQTAQLKPLRGFDRLAAAGFSEQDIAEMRTQFHAHSAGDYLDQEFASEEDLDEHARMLEEQWIESLDGGGALTQSSSSNSTILSGIVLGFFFPILPFFFFHPGKPAVFWDDGSEHEWTGTSIFSRKMQLGITAGFLLNVLFGIWTYMLASP